MIELTSCWGTTLLPPSSAGGRASRRAWRQRIWFLSIWTTLSLTPASLMFSWMVRYSCVSTTSGRFLCCTCHIFLPLFFFSKHDSHATTNRVWHFPYLTHWSGEEVCLRCTWCEKTEPGGCLNLTSGKLYERRVYWVGRGLKRRLIVNSYNYKVSMLMPQLV